MEEYLQAARERLFNGVTKNTSRCITTASIETLCTMKDDTKGTLLKGYHEGNKSRL